MPKGFRLTSETLKYDGLQEPSAWLEDYLTAVTCQRGSTSTAMQYIQLMLSGSARAWLKSLPRGAYTCWEDFKEDFVRNFIGTYKRPASFDKLRACKQREDETLREYIQRWTLLRNATEKISEDNAIYAFTRGVYRVELRETFGRVKPKTIAHLMQIDRKSTRLNSSHRSLSRMPSSA